MPVLGTGEVVNIKPSAGSNPVTPTMNKEIILDAFLNSPTKGEFVKKLGLDLSHKNGFAGDEEILIYTSLIGYSNREDISAVAFKQRWKEKQYNEYISNPNFCLNCGKIVPFERRNNKCCCKSCATSYANKIRGPRSEETKQKISESINKRILSGNFAANNQYTCSKNFEYVSFESLINEGIITNPYNCKVDDKRINKYRLIKKICPICNKEYYGYITKYGNISTTFCSEDCKIENVRIKCSTKAKERIENGTFQGWQSRNIISYPEKFWINVLNNNNIDFVKEYFIDKKYFLDFYIVKNGKEIDLEIDGKQHKYEDRVIHDQIRDEYITSKNILVYRIDWNEINTDNGKELMKEKIDNFLNWYNNL